MADALSRFRHLLPYDKILALREEQLAEVQRISHWDSYRERLASFSFPSPEELKLHIGDTVEIRASKEWEEEHADAVQEMVKALLPWRKGPFNYLGVPIDAEWRADLKWQRVAESLSELRGRRIADIGSNNGYYMYRMLPSEPELVVGFDPSSRCYYQFDLFQQTLYQPKLHFDLFGVEHMELFPEFFHVVFCMGVIYHRRDPYGACRQLYDCLAKNGVLYLETLIYPGDEPVTLCPEDRYAKMRNVWYVPTVSCLEVWLEKAGFQSFEVIHVNTVTTEEQRKTELAPYESLLDFLDPKDHSKTVEGYPAPTRAIVRALKG